MKITLLSMLIVFIVTMTMTAFCQQENKTIIEELKMQTIDIKTSAFSEGETIPVKYTCDSLDVSVPLSWSAPPEGTVSFALICDDPDAPMGTWVHWVLFNIPPGIKELPEGVSIAKDSSFAGAVEGKNDFGKTKYGGPCPPQGLAHRYYFKIYALDKTLDIDKKADKADVEKAMEGHILAQGQLMGKYKR